MTMWASNATSSVTVTATGREISGERDRAAPAPVLRVAQWATATSGGGRCAK